MPLAKDIHKAINQLCNAALQMLGLNFYSQGGEPGTITLNPGEQLRQNMTSLYLYILHMLLVFCAHETSHYLPNSRHHQTDWFKICRLLGKEENGWVRVKRLNSEEEVARTFGVVVMS